MFPAEIPSFQGIHLEQTRRADDPEHQASMTEHTLRASVHFARQVSRKAAQAILALGPVNLAA